MVVLGFAATFNSSEPVNAKENKHLAILGFLIPGPFWLLASGLNALTWKAATLGRSQPSLSMPFTQFTKFSAMAFMSLGLGIWCAIPWKGSPAWWAGLVPVAFGTSLAAGYWLSVKLGLIGTNRD